MHGSEKSTLSVSIWCISKTKRNRNESQCTLNRVGFTGPAGLASSAHGSMFGVVMVLAVKTQLPASWLMSQAGPASQTQGWNLLKMLTLAQVPVELELVLKLWAQVPVELELVLKLWAQVPMELELVSKLWAQVTVVLVGLDQGNARGYAPLQKGMWAYPELEWDGPLSPACCPLLLVLG